MAQRYHIEPDLDFIKKIGTFGGEDLKKCYQCATCSIVCELAPQQRPFPRKEMIWAQWGLKKKLFANPDVWLCNQCDDCSTHCPRGARPGDVMAAIRRETVIHYAFPRLLGRWVSRPKYIPLLMSIPAVLLGLALLVKAPIENAFGISKHFSENIVFSTTRMFPHWLLNSFFSFFTVLVFIATIVGVMRFWRAMKTAGAQDGITTPARGLVQSILSVLKSIITHNNLTMCTTESSRFLYHLFAFHGFMALFVVTLWVITAAYNPLIPNGFIYPFNFWNPWKMLANLGGIALISGCVLMIRDRLRKREQGGSSTFFDWAFIWTLLAVAITGLITELLHYARLEPHRYIAYFIHLAFVFALLMYLPYSKFAHLAYRTIAMVYAEYYDRTGEAS